MALTCGWAAVHSRTRCGKPAVMTSVGGTQAPLCTGHAASVIDAARHPEEGATPRVRGSGETAVVSWGSSDD